MYINDSTTTSTFTRTLTGNALTSIASSNSSCKGYRGLEGKACKGHFWYTCQSVYCYQMHIGLRDLVREVDRHVREVDRHVREVNSHVREIDRHVREVPNTYTSTTNRSKIIGMHFCPQELCHLLHVAQSGTHPYDLNIS